MEELIVALTEKHTQQMETLIKSTTEAMKEIMSLIKNEKKEPGKQSDEEKKKKQNKRQKKYNKHLYAKTAARNIQPKRRMSAENSKRTKTLARPTGSQRRAPEGARGP